MMTKAEAYKVLRAHGQTASYAFRVASHYAEWPQRRFQSAYPYSTEWLGIKSK